MRTIRHLVIAASALAVFGAMNSVLAQSSDALLDKLVEKGILTAKEASDLKEESHKNAGKDVAAKLGAPDWVNRIKFGGDFRGRYDGIWQEGSNEGPGSATADRERFRYRLRYGVTAELADHFEVGLRLGSGEIGSAAPSLGGSAFSANTTLNNDASRKFVFIDLAYAKWKPADWFGAQIGKMASEFWFTDMVLDPDYNPEGAQQKFTYAINKQHKLSLTGGEWVIAENFSSTGSGSANQDTYLFIGQADWAAKWSDHWSSRLGVAGYAFANQNAISSGLEAFLNQNGTSAAGTNAPHFNPIVARGEVAYTFASAPCFQGPFPITFGAEYANNPGAAHFDHQAYNVGLRIGDVTRKHNWALTYNYKHVGTAAVWHGLNDDDFGINARGGTGLQGHQVIGSYRLFDPLTLNLRFMRTEQIDPPAGVSSRQTRLFVDLLWAF
jgi:hypothetical protein